MPAGSTLDEEEKDKEEKASVGMEETLKSGVVKTERKNASSLTMYS